MNKGVQCVFTGRSRNRIAPIPELQQSGEEDDAVSIPCVNLGKAAVLDGLSTGYRTRCVSPCTSSFCYCGEHVERSHLSTHLLFTPQ